MSRACAQQEAFTLKRPWVLMVWDFTGWEIVKRSATRQTLFTGWEHVIEKPTLPYAIAKLTAVNTPLVNACDCPKHREKRKHFHPCPKGCGWMVACGSFECRDDLGPKFMCHVCSWQIGYNGSARKPPTDEEITRYRLRLQDASVNPWTPSVCAPLRAERTMGQQ